MLARGEIHNGQSEVLGKVTAAVMERTKSFPESFPLSEKLA